MSNFTLMAILTLAIAAVILVPKAIGWRQEQAEDFRQRQRQEAEQDAWVQRYVIDALKAPAEAINYNTEARNQIGKIHNDMFAAQGVQKVMTYWDQVSGEGFIDASADEDPTFRMNSIGDFWERSFEWYFMSRMGDACNAVRSGIRLENTYLNWYLTRHPEAWDKEIRPRLSLIVQSRGAPYGLAAHAAMALAAGGDRSPALRERLTELVQLSRYEAGDAARILLECGWPVPAPWPEIADLPALAPDGSSDGAPTALRNVATSVSFAGVPQFLDSLPDDDGVYLGVGPIIATPQNQWRMEPLEILRLDVSSGQAREVVLNEPAHILAASIDARRGLLATYEQIIDEQTQAGLKVPERYQLLLRDLKTGTSSGDMGPARNIITLHFDPYNDRLVALEQQSTVSIYDTANRQLLYRLPLHWQSPPVFAPRRIMAMMISDYDPLRLWDERRGLSAMTFNRMHRAPALARPMRGDLLAALNSHSLTMWDLSDIHREYPSFQVRLKMVSNARYQLKYSHEGRSFKAAALAPCAKLVVVLAGDLIVIFDTNGQPRGRLAGHKGRVLDVMFVGDKLVSTSMDQTVLVWDWAKVAEWCDRDLNSADASSKAAPSPATE